MHKRITVLFLGFSFVFFKSHALTQWKSSISDELKNEVLWKELVTELSKKEMNYGLRAAAERLLMFFSSSNIKEIAFKTIVALIDAGYPFSLLDLFVFGDIDVNSKDYFSESYNFYKSIINKNKGVIKWANYYLNKINKRSKKYKFYKAIEEYKNKKLEESKNLLYAILSEPAFPNEQVFVKKVARTLARILFEEKKFEESLSIYEDFLLKTNPVTPTDWIESAWSLFYLRRYDKALGNLYNLESSKISTINLEKYILRALIYRATCATNHMEELLKSYENDVKKAIVGIKSGGALLEFEELKLLSDISYDNLQAIYIILNKLQEERSKIKELPARLNKLATYLYSSEIKRFQGMVRYYIEKLTRQSARKLLMLNESIRFLTFDVERQKYNPDTVFKEDEKNNTAKIDGAFIIRWKQTGDYWRSERTKYFALLKNQCTN